MGMRGYYSVGCAGKVYADTELVDLVENIFSPRNVHQVLAAKEECSNDV